MNASPERADGPERPNVDDETLVTSWGLILEGFIRARRRIEADLKELTGLPGPSFEVLIRLSRSPGHQLPLTALARQVAFSSGGFTKVADRLVAGDLIERRPSPTDRRVTLAVLTPRGAEVIDGALRTHIDSLRRHLLQPLGPRRLDHVTAGMRVLRDAYPDG